MLNEEQLAVLQAPGNVLLLAGPGSGKTFMIVEKIINELELKNDSRKYIVAITYTRIAATEIMGRLVEAGYPTNNLWIGTIHSFCLDWILRPYSLKCKSLPIDFRAADPFEIEKVKSDYNLGNIPDYRYGIDGLEGINHPLEELDKNKIFKMFEKLYEKNLVTYEQILFNAYSLLSNNPNIAKNLSRIFQTILIDEFQDTSDLQCAILAQISKIGRVNFFIVGDPNQSIYENSGNQIHSKDEVESLFKIDFTEYSLSRNYRSSQKIVDYFSRFSVSHTSFISDNVLKSFDSKIRWDNETTATELADKISELIKYSVQELEIKPENIAILAPRWYILKQLHRELIHKIPEIGFQGVNTSAFERLYENVWYKVALLSVIPPSPENYPKRLRVASEVFSFFSHNVDMSEEADIFDILNSTSDLYKISKTDSIDFFKKSFELFCERHNFFNYIEGSSPVRVDYQNFFKILRENLGKYEEFKFIENIKKSVAAPNGVFISTIHGAKGLEFDLVIGFGLLEGYVPHSSLNSEKAIISAKKLLYVLTSRARKHLYIISEKNRNHYPNPTKILQELG